MSHALNKIWIHAIWATKERMPFIHSGIENIIYQYIADQICELGCAVKIINGMPDHIHCLFLLNRQKSIADVIKQLKGSSSHFINQHRLVEDKFAWQTGYAAFSISESAVDKVFQYIKRQKEHHLKITSSQEYNQFIKLYGLDKNGKDSLFSQPTV
ncbi:MAG: hypothetical protein RLY16_799 [Bacteroidota bacterium]|jgi:REP element-mobilizing transposase RayT